MANTKGSSVISNPSSGGAQSGLGEKFSPDLFTGTGNFSVPIAVPPGRNGFQPELTLGYSSGNGNGVFGMGWAMGIPGITRKTSKGIPVYDDKTDIFILSGAEDLVPVQYEKEITLGVTHEKTWYRPRTEGLFARIIRHKKTNGEQYWEVRSKDGLISWYGTPGATTNDPSVIANPDLRQSIYAWHLTKTEDPFGNIILYEYERELVNSAKAKTSPHIYDQVYLKTIRYAQYPIVAVPYIDYMCKVSFVYEDRPDPFSGYKQGFEVRTTKRCTKVETYTNAASELKTKTYHFNYLTDLPLNGASLLDSVEVEGHNEDEGENEKMPPLKFSYSVFEPQARKLETVSGPIPPNTLAEPGFELVDVTGNGLPDILQLGAGARYWTNKGNGKFGPPKNMNIAPSIGFGVSAKSESAGVPGISFIDANGNGRTDLLVMNGAVSGYFAGAFHKVWDNTGFRPYTQAPSFNLEDPEVKLLDLDGDGVTDVLRNGAKFECFYNDPDKGFYKVRAVEKTFANFSFADPRIRFADMTGDGLQDIVLISSGRVQYWPNMGYGRFGKMVNMKNAPVFPEQYNPSQVLIGDLDGDGQADIAFINGNSITLSINQAGNSFSDPVKILNTPFAVNPNGLRIVDIKGTGQAGLLWSFGPNANTGPGKMYFLDFTKGNKPYVMQEMNNNMGSITRVSYGSSVYHYLRDEATTNNKWKTDLPFPVQVVNKVEVLDLLSGGKLVTEYNYHNGYWDGVEREFRGFAHVDSFDTETFDKYNLQDLFSDSEEEFDVTVNEVNTQQYTPPVMTKSWFYVGPVGEGYSRWHEPDFSDEYWKDDKQVLEKDFETPRKNLLKQFPRWAQREALRTLRGTLLRSELYGLDKTASQDKPYTVTESCMSFRREYPDLNQISKSPNTIDKDVFATVTSDPNKATFSHCVFFPFNISQRTTQYERGTDPMHSFSFTKEYDDFGQAQGQLSIGVPRNFSPASGMAVYTGPDNTPPVNYLGTYALSEFIYINNESVGQYMKNRVKRSRSWDAAKSCFTTLPGPSNSPYTVFVYRNDIFANYNSLPVLSCTLNYYDGNAFIGENYGVIGAYGAQVRSETLIITDDIITDAYTSTPQCFVPPSPGPDWSATAGYPTIFAGLLQGQSVPTSSYDRLGYVKKTFDPLKDDYVTGWYAESTRLKYDFQVGDPYGLVLESRDVFDNWNSIDYDTYLLMPVTSTQYLFSYGGSGNSLVTEAEYDYRVIQPFKITDVNLNVSVFDFSPLGLLRATALVGKDDPMNPEGDWKSNSGGYYDRYAPSVMMEYDFFAFFNTKDPVWVKTISRKEHYQQNPTSETIIKVEYSDGFGRLLQTRVQAEDVIFGNQKFGDSGLPASQSAINQDAIGVEWTSGPLNVVVSGWKIYNNKGKVVEQFEPFFDSGFDYLLPDTDGVSIKMFYDPLGRVIKTVNPDNSQQWVIYGVPSDLENPPNLLPLVPPVSSLGSGGGYAPTPWINFAYDANDLASISYIPGNLVPSEHYFTPKSSLVDAFGRTIRTTEHIDKTNTPPIDNIVMKYQYDVRGNLVLVIDPLEREVFKHVYDLRTPQKDQSLPPIWTKHIDKGESTVLFDALGKPIESFDAKDAQILNAYDTLQRPTHNWAHDNSGETTTLRQFLFYGDSVTTLPNPPEYYNINGKLYQHYDEAGLITIPVYDFKGNVLEKTREVISDTELLSVFGGPTVTCYRVDWTGVPSSPPAILDAAIYETSMEYDALNRITKIKYPLDLDGIPRKELIPSYNNAGALESVEFDGDTYVQHVAYNAKGQRILIAYGNGIMTRYAYDSLTFRLLRQRSESYTDASWVYTPGGNVKQDTAYEYDLIGNIFETHDKTTGCGIGGTNSLDRNFDYDAIYRLINANGRENAPTITPIWDDSYRSTNDSTTTAYTQDYEYDKLGNILELQHTGNASFTRTFNYATISTNNLLSSVDIGMTNYAFTYDSCGNQLTETSSRFWEWDSQDKARCFYVSASSSITQYTQYLYDSDGKRVKKLTWKAGGIYDSISYIDGIFEYRTDGTDEQNLLHIMDQQNRIAITRVGDDFGDTTPAIKFNLEDQVRSSIVQLENDGTDINKEEYYPFGETSFGSYAKKRYKYCGKERDEESGVYYYGARYYSAWICKFISVDPLAMDYPFYTPFQYAGNKPIIALDIDGLEEYVITNTYNNAGQISSTNVVSYQNADGSLINQNLTDSSTGVNYSTFQGLIINQAPAGGSLPDGVPLLQSVTNISNVNLTGTTLTGVNYTALNGDSNRRNINPPSANPLPGSNAGLIPNGGANFNYVNRGVASASNYFGPSSSTNPTIERFSYTLNRQGVVNANFTRNSAVFASAAQSALASTQAQNIADWLNVFTSSTYLLTGNSDSGAPNNGSITYRNELGVAVPSAAPGAAAGTAGTVGGLKNARARAYQNLIIGFGIPASRVNTNFGANAVRNVRGRFQ